MDGIIIVKEPIPLVTLKNIANENGSELVKAVVDIKLQILAVGGYMHADEERLLLEEGSIQDDLWGINIYPDKEKKEWIEFDSMINIRSRQNNRSRRVEDPAIQKKITEIADLLIIQ